MADSYNTKINSDVEKSEFIFICTPISAYKNIFDDLSKFNLDQTIITDVGSSKVEVIKLANEFLKNKSFVPGHPIAGTEKVVQKMDLKICLKTMVYFQILANFATKHT